MTYYHHYSSPSKFEFTAFSESDLASDGNLSCGDTFTMPSSSTTCITVWDDDRYLSGDSKCYNDNADDRSWQKATIEVDGEEAGNYGQVYAEQYHWAKGSDGNWYVLIEIEQEGTNDDYFTFYTGGCYEVPPAGVELTVHSSCNVEGSWLDYKCLDAGEKTPPTGSICGRVFCDEDCDGIDGGETVIEGCDYTIEAEDMAAWGFKTVSGDQASGGKLVKLDGSNCYGQGDLRTTFDGKDGIYDFTFFIQDECDGQSKIKLMVNGEFVDAFRLNRDSDGGGSNNGGFSQFKIEGVELSAGDKIQIWVDGDHGEYVRFDKLVLEGRDEVVRTEEPGKEGVTVVLLNADGTEVLDENGQRITTLTDADGNYEFTDVPVGDYRVKFEAPDGTGFTSQNVGSDDTIDSDVNGMGVSDVFSVKADEETCDIDAGVKDLPGSLSGRYFCDTNDNDQDDNNGDEPGIEGVLVTLLDNNGNPVLDGAGAEITTLTDADGNYSFTGLDAGTYGVKFTDPNGVIGDKVLIAQNVGDDASDSDAFGDTVMSVIAGIEVVAGQDTPDNDAGVEEVNEAPEAIDASGMLCAVTDEADQLVFALADLATDADGDALEVTSITDAGADGVLGTADDAELAISAGNTVTLTSGAEVSLSADGQSLVYNLEGTGAFGDVLINDTASDAFGFTVSDGELSDTGAVDITVKGSLNTLETISDSLPAEICFTLDEITVDNVEDVFTMTLSGSGDDRFDGLIVAEAYCLEAFETFVYNAEVKATISLATESNVAAGVKNPTDFNTANNAAENINLINWIINQDFGSVDNGDGTGETYTDAEIQGAIWGLTDNTVFVFDGAGTAANAQEIIDAALASPDAATFEAGEGDLVALFIDPLAGQTFPGGVPSTTFEQSFVIAVAFDDLAEECECPDDMMM